MTEELAGLGVAALRFANHLRVLDGRGPLPALVMGHAQDCRRCPIAATANMGLRHDGKARWEVGAVAVKLTDAGNPPVSGDVRVSVPGDVISFMEAFDAGMFPLLLDPDSAVPMEPCDLVMAGADGLGL